MSAAQLLPISAFIAGLLVVAVYHSAELERRLRDLRARYDAEAQSNSRLRSSLAESRMGRELEAHAHHTAQIGMMEDHRREMDAVTLELSQARDNLVKTEATAANLAQHLEDMRRENHNLARAAIAPDAETDPASIQKPAACPLCTSSDLAIMSALWRVSLDPAVDPVRSGHRLGCLQCLTEWSLAHNGVTFNLRPGPGMVSTDAKERTNLGAVGLTPEEKVAGMAGRRAPRTDLRFRKPGGKRAAPIDDDEDGDA